MKVEKNGAVIDGVASAGNSIIGADYIVMWDNDGLPVHIRKQVVDYLYHIIHPAIPSSNTHNIIR